MSNQIEQLALEEFNWDLVGQSSPAVMQRALEYANLAALPNLSEQQADRLAEILEEATDNEILSFWIAEVDHLLGHHLGFLDEDCRESYQNQQALLRDYAGKEHFPVPIKEQISDYVCCPLTPCSDNPEDPRDDNAKACHPIGKVR